MYVKQGDDPSKNFSVDLNLDNKQFAVVTGTVYTIVASVSGIILGF